MLAVHRIEWDAPAAGPAAVNYRIAIMANGTLITDGVTAGALFLELGFAPGASVHVDVYSIDSASNQSTPASLDFTAAAQGIQPPGNLRQSFVRFDP